MLRNTSSVSINLGMLMKMETTIEGRMKVMACSPLDSVIIVSKSPSINCFIHFYKSEIIDNKFEIICSLYSSLYQIITEYLLVDQHGSEWVCRQPSVSPGRCSWWGRSHTTSLYSSLGWRNRGKGQCKEVNWCQENGQVWPVAGTLSQIQQGKSDSDEKWTSFRAWK